MTLPTVGTPHWGSIGRTQDGWCTVSSVESFLLSAQSGCCATFLLENCNPLQQCCCQTERMLASELTAAGTERPGLTGSWEWKVPPGSSTEGNYKITELWRLEKILKHIEPCCKPGTSKFTTPYILSSCLEEGKKINPGVSHHVWGEQGQARTAQPQVLDRKRWEHCWRHLGLWQRQSGAFKRALKLGNHKRRSHNKPPGASPAIFPFTLGGKPPTLCPTPVFHVNCALSVHSRRERKANAKGNVNPAGP